MPRTAIQAESILQIIKHTVNCSGLTSASNTVMRRLLGCNIVLTVGTSPNEDPMSLKYALYLTASKRQFLNMT